MLLIDCGNSALKSRWLNEDAMQDRVFPLIEGMDRSGFAEYLDGLAVSEICLSSVARAQLHDDLIGILQRVLPEVRVVELQTLPQLDGLTNGYRDFTRLGVDRWLTIVAASEISSNDVVIVDAGTAIKLELLSAQRGYLGGAILPGFNTTLQRFRGLFRDIDFASEAVEGTYLPGTTTAECIRQTPFPVTETDVAALIEQARKQLDEPVDLLLTGQDAGRIANAVDCAHVTLPDLVFRGMLKQRRSLG